MAAEAIVSAALEKARGLAIEEAKFLCGVKDRVEEIETLLEFMEAFLKEADLKRDEDERIRTWVAKIRELAYEVDDVLEAFAFEVESRRRGGFINILKRFVCIFCECFILHKIGSEINGITKKLTQLTATLKAFGVKNIGEGRSPNLHQEEERWLRQTYPHMGIEDDFVGMEEDIKKLVSRMANKDDQYCLVVSIWGMGGLGKTTLAKKIYNHADVRAHFDRFAWVCITQQCQTKNVLQSILKELLSEKKEQIMRLEERELVEQLYVIQKSKKCLIVLDDIWSMNAWKSLRPAFPIKEETGSKILLTTRTRNVAEVGFLYELKGLSETDAWELLQKKTFPGRDSSDILDDEQMKLGKKMAKDCGGLPLAIVVLGRLLATKRSLIEWELVGRNMTSYLSKGEGIEQEGVALRVLSLSYNELPYRLKFCFLYLGNFSEDCEIEVENLYQLWMAEGMLPPDIRTGEETMMDVGEKYLEELAHRSLVQVELLEDYSCTMRKFGRCRLHDLMREMCVLKAKEENFLKVVNFGGENEHKVLDASSSTSATNVRRLAIHVGKMSIDNRLVSSSFKKQISRHLRSLLVVAQSCNDGNMTHRLGMLRSHLKESKLLRVLDIQGFFFRESRDIVHLPKDVQNLIHLRYLRVNTFLLFSSSLAGLEHLETLDLRSCKLLCGPKVLQKMGQLRHLYLPEDIRVSHLNSCVYKDYCLSKLRLDGLSKLETLVGFYPSSCDVGDLSMLNNLRKLQVRVSELEDLEGIINYLNITPNYFRHTSLDIDSCDLSSDEGQSLLRQLFGCRNLHELSIWAPPIRKLPESNANCFASDLACLGLIKSELEDDPMPKLEKLPNLRDLLLSWRSFLGKDIHCSAMGFPKLRKLNLFGLTNLENWTVDEGAMPNLSNLSISSCSRLEMIPDGLRFVKKLQELDIGVMPEAFVNRLQVVDGRRGEDLDKVQHVPFISISH